MGLPDQIILNGLPLVPRAQGIIVLNGLVCPINTPEILDFTLQICIENGAKEIG